MFGCWRERHYAADTRALARYAHMFVEVIDAAMLLLLRRKNDYDDVDARVAAPRAMLDVTRAPLRYADCLLPLMRQDVERWRSHRCLRLLLIRCWRARLIYVVDG